MQTVGAVVLAILAFAVDATAQGLTGKDLQQYCGSAVLDYAGRICRGYVEGIIGSARSVDKSGKFKTNADGTWEEHLLGYRWCLSPETATVDELAILKDAGSVIIQGLLAFIQANERAQAARVGGV